MTKVGWRAQFVMEVDNAMNAQELVRYHAQLVKGEKHAESATVMDDALVVAVMVIVQNAMVLAIALLVMVMA